MNEDTARLGSLFSEDEKKKLVERLNEAKLPVIPEDVTLEEMERLLSYLGNEQAWLEDSLGHAMQEETVCRDQLDLAYAKAYVTADNNMPGATSQLLKMVASANAEVRKAKKDLMEASNVREMTEARLKSLQAQDVAVRKIASIRICALEKGLA